MECRLLIYALLSNQHHLLDYISQCGALQLSLNFVVVDWIYLT